MSEHPANSEAAPPAWLGSPAEEWNQESSVSFDASRKRKRPSEAWNHMEELKQQRLLAWEAVNKAKTTLSECQEAVQETTAQFNHAQDAVSHAANELCDKLLQHDNHFNKMYVLLKKHKEVHGHVNVRRNPSEQVKREDPNASRLAGWVGKVRLAYKQPLGDPSRLQEYQIVALNRLGFDWDPIRTRWFNSYQLLKDFYKEHGHSNVPVKDDNDGKPTVLYNWCKRQQHQYKLWLAKNPTTEMTEERVQLLEAVDFVWNRRQSQWMDQYEKLKEYKSKFGDTQPPSTPDYRPLQDWTDKQRVQYKLYQEDPQKSNLSKESFELLQKLPLDLEPRLDPWSTNYQALLEFKRQHGHCVLPSRYPLKPKLASWVLVQRKQYALFRAGQPSQMTEERIKLLEEAGFEWTVSDRRRDETSRALVKTWEEHYAEALALKETNGNLDPGRKRGLRTWLRQQHEEYQQWKKGEATTLTPFQAERLEAVYIDDFFSDVKPKPAPPTTNFKPWEQMYADLLVHRLNKGSFKGLGSKNPLRDWVLQQQSEYKKYVNGEPSLLTRDQIEKLNRVSFPWKTKQNSALHKSWEEMFCELLAFRIQYNTFLVPAHHRELYSWVSDQRHMYREHYKKKVEDWSKLDEERIKRLKEVEFPWHPQLAPAPAGLPTAPPIPSVPLGAAAAGFPWPATAAVPGLKVAPPAAIPPGNLKVAPTVAAAAAASKTPANVPAPGLVPPTVAPFMVGFPLSVSSVAAMPLHASRGAAAAPRPRPYGNIVGPSAKKKAKVPSAKLPKTTNDGSANTNGTKEPNAIKQKDAEAKAKFYKPVSIPLAVLQAEAAAARAAAADKDVTSNDATMGTTSYCKEMMKTNKTAK